jgi:hypothetical protein
MGPASYLRVRRGVTAFPGWSRIVRVTREIPHILPPSSLIHSDRFDPANAACDPPASHRSIPVEYLLRWQRRGVGAALSTALEARLWGSSVSPREAPLSRGRNSHLTQGLPGGLGECQSGDDAGKGGGDEVEGGRDRVARGRQEGGEDQGCRPAEDGDREAVAQRE